MRIVIVTGSVLRLPGHYYASQPEPAAEGMLKKLWKLLKYANCIMVTGRDKMYPRSRRRSRASGEKETDKPEFTAD